MQTPEARARSSAQMKAYWQQVKADPAKYQQVRERISQRMKGHVSDRKGMSYEEYFGSQKATEIKQKISQTQKQRLRDPAIRRAIGAKNRRHARNRWIRWEIKFLQRMRLKKARFYQEHTKFLEHPFPQWKINTIAFLKDISQDLETLREEINSAMDEFKENLEGSWRRSR